MSPKSESCINLINKADRDLEAAKILYMNSMGRKQITEGICFHSQQCIEKYLRAFLIFHEYDYPFTHDLDKLAGYYAKFDSRFAEFDFEAFKEYGVGIRYDAPSPSIEDARKAIYTADEVSGYVFYKIDIIDII